MKIILKKYWLHLTLIVIIIPLAIATILNQKNTNPTNIQPTTTTHISTPEGKSNTIIVEYSGKNSGLPERFSSYQYESQPPQDFAAALASKLGLTQHPQSNNLWLNNNLSLNYVEETGQVDITFNIPRNNNRGINIEQNTKTADEYLQSIGLDNTLLLTNKIILTNATGEFVDTQKTKYTATNASLLIIPFSYQANNIPIFFEDSRATDSIIVVNANSEITKISFTAPPPKITTQKTAPSVTINQAIKKIGEGEGVFIHLESGKRQTVTANSLSSLELTRMEFEYRLISGQNKIVPYFHFYGIGKTSNDKEITTEVLIEAIQ